MKITAIIAEYNPFHNGHLKQLRAAKRETDADALAVVMSGSFTLRGDMCVTDKFTRARWAVEAGADIVLELPTVYSLSPAKSFACGAVKTLSMLKDFTLSFGTEAEELENLRMAAEFMNSESHDMSRLLRSFLSEGYSVAKSRTLALDKLRPDISNMVQSPNNILAVEYLKAGAAYGEHIKYHNVARKPDDGKKILSSTKIRALLSEDKDISPYVPDFVRESIVDAVNYDKYNTIASYALKSKSAEELGEIANISEGFENRISNSDFTSMDEFFGFTNKRYTRSTIKRMAACAAAGVTKELAKLAQDEKPYCTVLAVKNSKKRALLSLLDSSDGYFYYKSSDCPSDSPVYQLVRLDRKAADILALCKTK